MAKKGGASNDKKATDKGGKGKGKATAPDAAETETKGKVSKEASGCEQFYMKQRFWL